MRSKSLGAFWEFVGESAEGVSAMVKRVESAGGFDIFVANHEIYSAMSAKHREYARACYKSRLMRLAMRVPRIVANWAGITKRGPWEP